jgi:hypothetical protein
MRKGEGDLAALPELQIANLSILSNVRCETADLQRTREWVQALANSVVTGIAGASRAPLRMAKAKQAAIKPMQPPIKKAY